MNTNVRARVAALRGKVVAGVGIPSEDVEWMLDRIAASNVVVEAVQEYERSGFGLTMRTVMIGKLHVLDKAEVS